jgi:hypothetical protein
MRTSTFIVLMVAAVFAAALLFVRERRDRAELEELRASVARLTVVPVPSSEDGKAPSAQDILARALAARAAVASADAVSAEGTGDGAKATSGAGGSRAKGPAPARGPTMEDSQRQVLVAYANEPVDPGWSRDAARTLDSTLRKHTPEGARVESLDCRTSLCEIEIEHLRPDAASTFAVDAFAGWPGSVFVAGETRNGDDVALTLVASREGARIPVGPTAVE